MSKPEIPSKDGFTVGNRTFTSRLLVGTGKYQDMTETRAAIEASGAEIVTIAVRRTNIGQNSDEPNILDVLPPEKYTILPNTAGCYDAKTAVRTCRLARELLDGHNLVKLEVLGDEKTLFPDVIATLNLNGDYMSDAAAAQVGGLGMAPGANIGDGMALFEATHGTAPKYAGQDKVNPSSLILSGVMMLQYMGWTEAANLIVDAMTKTVEAKTVTYDLERQMAGATLLKCSEYAQAIVDNCRTSIHRERV